MTQTLAALLFAHVLADFVLQTARMAATKRQPTTLAHHWAIVLETAAWPPARCRPGCWL